MRTFVKKTHSLIIVKTNGKTIEVTSEHPFYTKNRGWVAASDLTNVDLLEDSEGNTIVIDELRTKELDSEAIVYNFEVDVNHNYYVSELSLLVHNRCDVGVEGTGKAKNLWGKWSDYDKVTIEGR